jgi:hypothetical protein
LIFYLTPRVAENLDSVRSNPHRFHLLLHRIAKMPSATGSNWEQYKKEYADDEVAEKKITPLSDE